MEREKGNNPRRSTLDSASSDTIKTECNPVLKALERGDYADARNIMTEVRLRHRFSALVHRILCSVNFYIASKLEHNSLQIQAHLEIAVEAAKRAHLLSPNSILFSLLYARMLLFAASNKKKCYEEVVRVCEQAFSIHNPIDPAKFTLNGESHYKDSTAEQRIAYVKKELQKLIKNSKNYSCVQTKNTSDEQNLGLLKTRNSDFRVYLSSFKADDVLSEAISFATKNRKWKFWACCNCDEKFVDSESYLHHLKQEHRGNLSFNLESVLPTEIDSHLVEEIVNGRWFPVDTGAAMKTIQSRSKYQLDKPVSVDPNWPLSDDSERSETLGKIHGMLQLLLNYNYLAQSHLDKLMQYTMEEMQKSVSASQFLIQSPLFIRFLGASQLETVLQLLQELAYVCGLNKECTDDAHHALDGNQGYGLNDGVDSTEESSRLDNRSQHLGLMPSTYDYSVGDDDQCIISLLESWTYACNNRKHRGRKVFERLEKEWRLLQGMCEEKCKCMSLKEALQQVTLSICVEEYEKMEEERTGRNGDAISSSSRVELDVISTALKEAPTFNAEQFQFEETLTGVTSCFHDLECNIPDYQHQEDTCIKLAIQRQMKWLSTELSKIDAKIMHANAYMKQLEAEIAGLSVHNLIMLPLLSTFIRAQLEDLVGKDATEALVANLLAKQDEKLGGILQAEVAETITSSTRNDDVQSVTFQNEEARDRAKGEVAVSTLVATIEDAAVEVTKRRPDMPLLDQAILEHTADVSRMGGRIPHIYLPLLEKALVYQPNLEVAIASLPDSLRHAVYKQLGRVLKIFVNLADCATDESILEEARLIIEALRKLDLDVLWLDRRFAIAKKVLRRSQQVVRREEHERMIANLFAQLGQREDEPGVISNICTAEFLYSLSLLTSYKD